MGTTMELRGILRCMMMGLRLLHIWSHPALNRMHLSIPNLSELPEDLSPRDASARSIFTILPSHMPLVPVNLPSLSPLHPFHLSILPVMTSHSSSVRRVRASRPSQRSLLGYTSPAEAT